MCAVSRPLSDTAGVRKKYDRADAFVARYADTILRLAMTYSLSRADAQDICQDVFCRLLQSDLNFDSPAAERAYVLRSTINACKDLLKSAWRRKHTALDHASHIPAPASRLKLENFQWSLCG